MMQARRSSSGSIVEGMSDLIEKGADAPLHRQIQRILEEKIGDGTLKAGDRLPAEDELTREFGVSRMTVRQALASLANDGLIYRRHGKGTFVGEGKVTRQIAKLSGFSEDITGSGHTPGARTIAISLVPAPAEVAEALGCGPKERVVLVHRLRTLDDVPAAIQRSFLVAALVPGLEGMKEDFRSLYNLLRTRYGLTLNRADQVIEARVAAAEEAKLLEVGPHMPVVQVSRTTFLDDGRPAEFVRMVYRADMFRFRMRLWREATAEKTLSVVVGGRTDTGGR